MQAWPVAHCEATVQASHVPETQTCGDVHCELPVHAPQTPETHA
jgi:hypothetical protein